MTELVDNSLVFKHDNDTGTTNRCPEIHIMMPLPYDKRHNHKRHNRYNKECDSIIEQIVSLLGRVNLLWKLKQAPLILTSDDTLKNAFRGYRVFDKFQTGEFVKFDKSNKYIGYFIFVQRDFSHLKCT